MSQSERKCDFCQRPATRMMVRADLGGADDRMLTCGADACKPPEGTWESYALDADGLAKDYKDKEAGA